jgi:crotonobetainyl-CoA:carnitine CoA-transferase CaiB-like acyl-CoA transferase
MVRDAVRAHGYDELARLFDAAGAGYTEVLSPEHVMAAPQAREPRKFTEVAFQGMTFEAPDFPLSGQVGPRCADAPPLLGEHTREILQSAGYTDAECDELIAGGAAVVASADQPLWAVSR